MKNVKMNILKHSDFIIILLLQKYPAAIKTITLKFFMHQF